ncbi:hypothetical protein V8F20_008471 [Naviculisporaceae sp. PSN 640]
MATPTSGPERPNLSSRMASTMIMGMTGVISRSVLYGLNTVEVTGLKRFQDVLDSRQDVGKRQRGLLTVSNHVSVVDDPLVWGLLPLSYAFNPSNLRWTLGAHDICFANKLFSSFFTSGQVLPTHRLKHSTHGGLFQPSITQAIRLLSSQPYSDPSTYKPAKTQSSDIPDPFTAGSLTYTTNGTDIHPSPSIYPSNRHSWVHIFPEGLVHQHPDLDLRYFKWGVARLILESEPAPDVLPMFIDGTQRIMPEDRGFPRFLPRMGKNIRVAFGEVLDYESTFGDLRRRWHDLVQRTREKRLKEEEERLKPRRKRGSLLAWLNPFAWPSSSAESVHEPVTTVALAEKKPQMLGEITDPELMYSKEANAIRIEVARRMREEILKVRKSLGGYPESDPKLGKAETWCVDDEFGAKKYRSRVDGSQINQD